MSAGTDWLDRQAQRGIVVPGAGALVVFRRQMRGRIILRDLLWAVAMLAALFALSALLQAIWLQRSEAGDSPGGMLLRWLTTSMLGAALLFLPFAAVLGASAAPSSEEAEATQAALLTHLKPAEIVAGRLAAALWPMLIAIGLSCGWWLIAQAGWRCVSDLQGGTGAILLAHFTLLCLVYMVAAVGCLCSGRRRPGRAWGRGAGFALLWGALCTTVILLVNPQVKRMDDPVRLIEGALLVNPVAAVSTSLKLDLLRTQWLYDHSDAPAFEFAYPPPLASAGLFLMVGLSAQGLAALRLRRAYRT